LAVPACRLTLMGPANDEKSSRSTGPPPPLTLPARPAPEAKLNWSELVPPVRFCTPANVVATFRDPESDPVIGQVVLVLPPTSVFDPPPPLNASVAPVPKGFPLVRSRLSVSLPDSPLNVIDFTSPAVKSSV